MADALGNQTDVTFYTNILNGLNAEFNTAFYNSTGTYDFGKCYLSGNGNL
jgi:hypothetical protein